MAFQIPPLAICSSHSEDANAGYTLGPLYSSWLKSIALSKCQFAGQISAFLTRWNFERTSAIPISHFSAFEHLRGARLLSQFTRVGIRSRASQACSRTGVHLVVLSLILGDCVYTETVIPKPPRFRKLLHSASQISTS